MVLITMKSLKISTFVSVAALFVAPSHAYERCKSFEKTELKAMSAERLEKEYCWNEDRLIEILDIVRSDQSEQAKRDRDACWQTLINLSAQPRFDRDEKCRGAAPAGVSTSQDEAQQRKRELLRNLGIPGQK